MTFAQHYNVNKSVLFWFHTSATFNTSSHAQLGITAMLEPVTHVLMVFAEWQPGLSHVVCVLTN